MVGALPGNCPDARRAGARGQRRGDAGEGERGRAAGAGGSLRHPVDPDHPVRQGWPGARSGDRRSAQGPAQEEAGRQHLSDPMSTVGPGLPPLSPTREEFHALAAQGNLIPLFAALAPDLDTPLAASLRLRPGPYSFLLESVEGGEKWARYSFLGTDPHLVLTAKGSRVSVRRADGTTELVPSRNPFGALSSLRAQFKAFPVSALSLF